MAVKHILDLLAVCEAKDLRPQTLELLHALVRLSRSMYAEELALTLQALARYELGNPTDARPKGLFKGGHRWTSYEIMKDPLKINGFSFIFLHKTQLHLSFQVEFSSFSSPYEAVLNASSARWWRS